MFVWCISFLITSLTVLVLFKRNKNMDPQAHWDQGDAEKCLQLKNLQYRYLSVFLLATFSDWLQGPYLYQLYHEYGFNDSTISNLFLVGFLSSTLCGTVVGYFADCYGRRRMCITFCGFYAISCLTKASSVLWVLAIGRVLGGMATSILFSAFSSWYIHEHQQRLKLPPEWMNYTFGRATFFNGLLAIVAGIISCTVADVIGLGPLAPFMMAIPILLTAALVTFLFWDENRGSDFSVHVNTLMNSISKSMQTIFSSKDRTLFHLGMVQVMFEPAMYTFIIAWTPMLAQLEIALGLVFASFMLCIMLGSVMYTTLISHGQSTPDQLLGVSMRVATVAMIGVAVLTSSQMSEATTQICYLMFLLFEIAVGMYYPSWGYLASRSVPEELRASIASWFRFPMNILTCLCLQWTSKSKTNHDVHSQPTPNEVYHFSFVICVALLIVACWSSQRLSHVKTQNGSTGEILEA